MMDKRQVFATPPATTTRVLRPRPTTTAAADHSNDHSDSSPMKRNVTSSSSRRRTTTNHEMDVDSSMNRYHSTGAEESTSRPANGLHPRRSSQTRNVQAYVLQDQPTSYRK